MYRNNGIPLTFGILNDNESGETRNLGELVARDENGKVIVNPSGDELTFFPLTQDIKEDDKDANVTAEGWAKVFVESAAGIVCGSKVGLGATSKGIAAYGGGHLVGVAQAKPKGDGDFIPVSLVNFNPESIY